MMNMFMIQKINSRYSKNYFPNAGPPICFDSYAKTWHRSIVLSFHVITSSILLYEALYQLNVNPLVPLPCLPIHTQ
jgi:hypothetical protein